MIFTFNIHSTKHFTVKLKVLKKTRQLHNPASNGLEQTVTQKMGLR